MGHVRLDDHPVLAAAVAGDAQEPAREPADRLLEGLGAGRQRVVAVGPPVAHGDGRAGHPGPWPHFARSSHARVVASASPIPATM
jgi:hypothetical protein